MRHDVKSNADSIDDIHKSSFLNLMALLTLNCPIVGYYLTNIGSKHSAPGGGGAPPPPPGRETGLKKTSACWDFFEDVFLAQSSRQNVEATG